jgi:hypothetical protein
MLTVRTDKTYVILENEMWWIDTVKESALRNSRELKTSGENVLTYDRSHSMLRLQMLAAFDVENRDQSVDIALIQRPRT